MNRVVVATEPPYEVWIGTGVLAQAASCLGKYRRCALIADRRAYALHGAKLGAEFSNSPRRELEPGEAGKSLAELGATLEFMAQVGLDRRSCLLTFGGGVVGDLGGLAAALYMRGIDVIHLPTTLLAMVDASVGGKSGVNLPQGKNLVGLVHQPKAVLADLALLSTLGLEEWQCGLGEVAKTAWLGGEEQLCAVERLAKALRERDTTACLEAITRCVSVKAAIVAADPAERDQRRALNLGHTFAHAIEHAAGYGKIPHGVAVGVGLMLALRASELWGSGSQAGLWRRGLALLEALGMPSSLRALRERWQVALTVDELWCGMSHDKKGAVGSPEFVLLRAPGKALFGQRQEEAQVRDLLSTESDTVSPDS